MYAGQVSVTCGHFDFIYPWPLQILKRINAEIEDRRAAGEDLPPPPKTAIAGPEYFGFNQAEVLISRILCILCQVQLYYRVCLNPACGAVPE